jgi:hypothetical protein
MPAAMSPPNTLAAIIQQIGNKLSFGRKVVPGAPQPTPRGAVKAHPQQQPPADPSDPIRALFSNLIQKVAQ